MTTPAVTVCWLMTIVRRNAISKMHNNCLNSESLHWHHWLHIIYHSSMRRNILWPFMSDEVTTSLADNPSNIGVCDISYYQKAIETIRKQHTDAHYFFFSDDIEWVRNHFSDDNATFIKKEETEPDYVDLYLMTKCKAHIIANSTFSFWGSLLTDHEKHLCIYPKRWFANPEWTVPDIFPSHWIAL